MCDGGLLFTGELLVTTLREEKAGLLAHPERYTPEVAIQGCAAFYGFGAVRGVHYTRPEPVVLTDLELADCASVVDADVVATERDGVPTHDGASVVHRVLFKPAACLWSKCLQRVA